LIKNQAPVHNGYTTGLAIHPNQSPEHRSERVKDQKVDAIKPALDTSNDPKKGDTLQIMLITYLLF
jgi:hypothetical protein